MLTDFDGVPDGDAVVPRLMPATVSFAQGVLRAAPRWADACTAAGADAVQVR